MNKIQAITLVLSLMAGSFVTTAIEAKTQGSRQCNNLCNGVGSENNACVCKSSGISTNCTSEGRNPCTFG